MGKSIQDQIKAARDIIGPYKADFKMPFGKFEGEDLSDIPKSYLEWLIKTGVADYLEYKIEIELLRREKLKIK